MVCQRLPTAKEIVVIGGLVSSPELNGEHCIITRYDRDVSRYRVKMKLDDGSNKVLSIKPQNITLLPNKSSSIRGNDSFYYSGDWNVVHVLVPCHLDTRRRYEQFRQCSRSLVEQKGRCRILISISGKRDLCELAMETLRIDALNQNHQWIVSLEGSTDNDYTKKSQFQHYKSLVEVSAEIKANAWIMFLDNDDMYHPLRVRYFQEIIAKRKQETHIVEKAFYCGGKLLIDVGKANAKFGNGDTDIITYDKIMSFDDELSDIVGVAGTYWECNKKNAIEYFDFCVHTEVMQRFMEVAPDGILANQFCDVRFCGSLSHPKIKTYDHPTHEWLLMHFRVSLYDTHQRFLQLDSSTFTNAMLRIDVSDDDRHLAELTGLSDTKIAFLRRDIEECAIQCVHRDDANMEFFYNRGVPGVDKDHGHDIGTFIWNEVIETLEGYYTEETAEQSKQWWIECGIPPPPEEDEAHTDDKSMYW